MRTSTLGVKAPAGRQHRSPPRLVVGFVPVAPFGVRGLRHRPVTALLAFAWLIGQTREMTPLLRVLVPLAAVALLAGCAAASPTPGSEAIAPPAAEVEPDAEVEVETSQDGGTLVSIADGVVPTPEGFDNRLMETAMPFGHTVDDQTFTVTVWGSSSCPWVPTLMATSSFDTVSMFFEEEPGDMPCRANMATTTYEFTVPENIDDTLGKISIRHPDLDEAIHLKRDGDWLLPEN